MSERKYMIRCDMEGVTGIVSYEQAEPGRSEYSFGLRMFMSDLNACVEGLLEGGADQVVIYDEHYYGRNIDLAALPPNVTAICGKPPYTAKCPGGLDDSFTGMILLGLHSMAGTGELLHHTYEPDIQALWLNDVRIGEIGMESAIAGDHGVPVVLVTADSAGADEAQVLLPGVQTVSVKQSLGAEGALCYSAVATAARIKDAAKSIVQNTPAFQPYKLTSPVELRVILNAGPYLHAVRQECNNYMTDEHTLTIRGDTASAVWSDYWQIKLHCQSICRKQDI